MSLSPEHATRACARSFSRAAAPRSPHVHLWQGADGWQMLQVDGSQIFTIGAGAAEALRTAEPEQQPALLHRLGLERKPQIDDQLCTPPLYALSLAVAQKCNLGCTYCYAQQGDFGGNPRNMTLDTARRAIDLLLDEAGPGGRANLAFLGGEPLVNRRVLIDATEYAARQAAEIQVTLSFAITSNGTLLRPADAEFFERHGFAVTISLDGIGAQHDRLRPFRDGRGSYGRILERVQPLLEQQRRMQVSARVTVTPLNQQLPEVLAHFIAAGFHSVGFSPLLRSPDGVGELDAAQLERMLGQMIACGEATEARLKRGERYPFANLLNALRELGRGTHRPYPCGAGAAYLGVSAEGELAACHRFVGDPLGALGTLHTGIDRRAQQSWLQQRHVHQQSPCKQCWARYLCGGGCHHEVIARGRPACDYIRGWLHYCLQAWSRLASAQAIPGLTPPGTPPI